ncbi:MAG: DUF2235 domain-containing protein [Pseudomonadota bacterium]
MQKRPPRTHVFIIDGTLSRLHEGYRSNAGRLYKLLDEVGQTARQTVTYDPGIQGEGWGKWLNVAAGLTINQSIEAGYAMLSSRYALGDRIMIFGYSRGAYAARSLAGFIGRIGLLKRNEATQRRVHRAFRYYQAREMSDEAQVFARQFCHPNIQIDLLGVWDTVRALGLPYPLLSRLAPMATEFHDHNLGHNVRWALQALALDENRTAYAPLPWKKQPGWNGLLEQVWFAGAHSDVGGQLGHFPAARPLGNIPLVWMLERAEMAGLILPPNWRERFETDAAAPAIGAFRRQARFFLARAPRQAGACGSEAEHPSVQERRDALPGYRPKARWVSTPQPMHQMQIS